MRNCPGGRLKIDVCLVYGKTSSNPRRSSGLRGLTSLRTSFCKNLHAKFYLNEQFAIVTSLNLYEFSQVNNNKMGVLISRETDAELFHETSEEAHRIIRISEEVRMSFERVTRISEEKTVAAVESEAENEGKFSTSKLARGLGLKTHELLDHLVQLGAIEVRDG